MIGLPTNDVQIWQVPTKLTSETVRLIWTLSPLSTILSSYILAELMKGAHEGKVALRHPSSKNLTCNEFLATNNSLLHEMPADVFNCRFPTKNLPPSTYIMQDPKILRETINRFLVLLSSSHGFGFEQERNDTRLHCKRAAMIEAEQIAERL